VTNWHIVSAQTLACLVYLNVGVGLTGLVCWARCLLDWTTYCKTYTWLIHTTKIYRLPYVPCSLFVCRYA